MARALWTGSLAFGLVNVPVEIHTAVRDIRPQFHLLRARDKSRIHFQRVAAKDSKVVDWDDIVRGYEYAKGRYIILSAEDLEKAAAKRDRVIDILDFVKADDVDDRYFEKPYYLLPGKGGDRPYALLREAIRESGRIGIAKFVLRETEHLAAVEAIDDALVLSTMRFREALVKLEDYDFPPAKLARSRDLKLAERLIAEFASDWDPDKYTDEYRRNIMAVIKAREKHQAPDIEVAEPEQSGKVVDLMERLRQSLGNTNASPGHRRTAKKTTGRRKTSTRKHAATRRRRSAKHAA